MSNKNMSRRLKRIESALAPPKDKPGVIIIVSTPGRPDEIRKISLEPGRKRTGLPHGGR